jgi:hypothetical protein
VDSIGLPQPMWAVRKRLIPGGTVRLDQLQYINICRDEDCTREDIHNLADLGCTAGVIARGAEVVKVAAKRILREVVLNNVGSRLGRPFTSIYRDVVDDYGTVTERSVYRALADLIQTFDVAFVVPAGLQHAVARGGLQGTYVRYDSPLLWTPGGLHELMSYAAEARVEN